MTIENDSGVLVCVLTMRSDWFFQVLITLTADSHSLQSADKDQQETRMRGKAQPDGRPAVELIETLVRLSLIPTRATPLFD